MKREQFIELRQRVLDACDQITKTKGVDYTKSSDDCLANFKEGSVFGLTSLQTAGMFAKKHIDSIYNYIKTNGRSESEPIEGRIQDAINYLLFIQALIEEEQFERNKAAIEKDKSL